ncbi:ankyrin repeat domain-containing protein [Legionella hackeliae]|uniref:Uncharacterized protein n=1 Tax=Legionella hackeliae TaxID=449 RepID=A0A0A8UUL3_LEGHA|nr:ankyrin repeat domain-containing protein [Legionella hackeliae]KTD06651.1 Ankyrin repeats (3 copies) [Legionella hackeliae]CEK10772.1 protein of unknown function [ankyrin repeat] [Legionella hackeliae]STX47510.1 Ankyrin repeats (3 copies) [Legionella hackeliae]
MSTIDSGYIDHKFESYKILVNKYIDSGYGEISLFQFFKENYYCRSQNFFAASLGAGDKFELWDEALKIKFMKFATKSHATYFPILDGVFAENPNILKELGDTPIACVAMKNAVAYFNVATIACLVKDGASVDQKDPKTGLAPVHIVVKEFLVDSYKVDAIRFLKGNGADILAKDNEGKTILDYLDFNKEEDIKLLKFLIEIEPRIAIEHPQLLTINLDVKNPILDLLGDEKKVLTSNDLLENLKGIDDICQKLFCLDEAYKSIIANDNIYSAQPKHRLQSYNEAYSDRQLKDIQALKFAYCDLIKSEVDKGTCDKES